MVEIRQRFHEELRAPDPGRLRPAAADGQARERLAAHLAKTDRLANRFQAKRMRATKAEQYAS